MTTTNSTNSKSPLDIDQHPISKRAGLRTQHTLYGNNTDAMFKLAKFADESGLDIIGIHDHPYNDGFFDTYTHQRPSFLDTKNPLLSGRKRSAHETASSERFF